MSLILDSGSISALARQRSRLAQLRQMGEWPPRVPAVVLTEVLTGDHRRDFEANRFLKTCVVTPVDEVLARHAAFLRSGTSGRRVPSAVDAVVVALADSFTDAVVLTSDPRDLQLLAQRAGRGVRIATI